MDRKSLVILAAGIGSRYCGGVKQLDPVGPNGELIIDYSIHDAIAAGFNKIIFIIRHDIETDFREKIGNRIERICGRLGVDIVYAFQEKSMYVSSIPEGREKPWGTGHAILCASKYIDSPFAVINADDYYGQDGYIKSIEFLSMEKYGMVGYVLKNTLSDNGKVTRGICTVNDNKIVGISETKNILKSGGDAFADGKKVDANSLVSMNFWCFPLGFIDYLMDDFPQFIAGMKDSINEEYLLPNIADCMIKSGIEFTVLPTFDKWFGVTYKEDKTSVVENINNLHQLGRYSWDLYSDL